MNKYRCIAFDENNHRFFLYQDEAHNILFSYWHELKKHKRRYLEAGSSFLADITPNKRFPHSRGMTIHSIELQANEDTPSNQIYSDKHFSSKELCCELEKTSQKPPIFINCTFDNVELDEIEVSTSVAFIDCTFEGNFRLVNCDIFGNLWLPNCRFKKHFSLKDSQITGNVHLEGADFTGLGGASFRGMKADNLYIDLGVKGGDDLFWLNEMEISGVVSIGGHFYNEVQILYQQDKDEELKTTPTIGAVIIGRELYDYEKANQTHIDGHLKIESMPITDQIHIESTSAQTITVQCSIAPLLECHNLAIENDCIIKCNIFCSMTDTQRTCLSLTDSSIGRHLMIDKNQLSGKTDLNGSAISEVTYLEDNDFKEHSTIDLNRFTTSRLLIHPAETLYRNSKSKIFSPKQFSLLSLEHLQRSETDSRLLADQYCSLKHWLADAGRLELEDISFFHMRSNYNPSTFSKLFLGGIFGWGVRLSNIAISSIAIILVFTLIYLAIIPDIGITTSLALSAQSFISSFFGEWASYEPDGVIANVVTLESFVGVIFITVFIGAYIRKLLR